METIKFYVGVFGPLKNQETKENAEKLLKGGTIVHESEQCLVASVDNLTTHITNFLSLLKERNFNLDLGVDVCISIVSTDNDKVVAPEEIAAVMARKLGYKLPKRPRRPRKSSKAKTKASTALPETPVPAVPEIPAETIPTETPSKE